MKNIEATADAFRAQIWKFLCAIANLRVKLLDKFEGSDWRKFIKGEVQPHFDDPETQSMADFFLMVLPAYEAVCRRMDELDELEQANFIAQNRRHLRNYVACVRHTEGTNRGVSQ